MKIPLVVDDLLPNITHIALWARHCLGSTVHFKEVQASLVRHRIMYAEYSVGREFDSVLPRIRHR